MSESILCKFVSYLASEGLKHRSIKTYLSGVRYLQIRSGFPDPFHGSHMPRLDYTVRGVKRVESERRWFEDEATHNPSPAETVKGGVGENISES